MKEKKVALGADGKVVNHTSVMEGIQPAEEWEDSLMQSFEDDDFDEDNGDDEDSSNMVSSVFLD